MSNILNFPPPKKQTTKKQSPSILEELKNDIFGQENSQKKSDEYVKSVKKELRKRGVKNYKLTHKDLPFLKRDESIIFPKLKLAFSKSIPDDLSVDSAWTVIQIEADEDTDVLATVNTIIKKIGE